MTLGTAVRPAVRPAMAALSSSPSCWPHWADGLEVRPISSMDSGLYRTTIAAGYEEPDALLAVFARPSMLDHPTMRGYVAELGGTGVATSFGVLVSDFVGMFNIGVPPRFRRRGYGRTATAGVLHDAYALGARTTGVLLQLGYERLGNADLDRVDPLLRRHALQLGVLYDSGQSGSGHRKATAT